MDVILLEICQKTMHIFFIIEESSLNTQSILHFYRHSHHSMDFLYFVAFPKYKFKLFFLSHFVAISIQLTLHVKLPDKTLPLTKN